MPVAMPERILAHIAVLQRVGEVMDLRGPPPDESAIEWHRLREEVDMVLEQHRMYETPFKPFG